MKRSFRNCLTLGILLIRCSPGFGGSLPAKELTTAIEVRVYDYSGVPAGQLAEMETEVTRILGQAEIPPTWLNCRVPSTERAEHPDCKQPRTPTSIVLRIVEGGSATRKRFGYTGLGFSAVADEGGCLATVIMSRVEQLSREGAATRGEILGHAAAHEIGHLLLHSTSHSVAGIMQARWDRGDLRKMAKGSLLFTSQESTRMRKNVIRRLGR